MPWYIKGSSKIVGPVSSKDLQRLAKAGRLTASNLVSRAPDGPWRIAGGVKELIFGEAATGGRTVAAEVTESPGDNAPSIEAAPSLPRDAAPAGSTFKARQADAIRTALLAVPKAITSAGFLGALRAASQALGSLLARRDAVLAGGGGGLLLGACYGYAISAILMGVCLGACIGLAVCGLLLRTVRSYKPLTLKGMAATFVATSLMLVALHAVWIARTSDSTSYAPIVGLQRSLPKSVLSTSEWNGVTSSNAISPSGKSGFWSSPAKSSGEVIGHYEGETPRPLTDAIVMLCESQPEPVDVCFVLRKGPDRVVTASSDRAVWTWMATESNLKPDSGEVVPPASAQRTSTEEKAASDKKKSWWDRLDDMPSSPVPVHEDQPRQEDVSPLSQVQAQIDELEQKLRNDSDNAQIKSQIASLKSLLVPVSFNSRDTPPVQETDRVGKWLPSAKTKEEVVANWVSRFRADDELMPIKVQRVVVDGKACIMLFATDGQKLSDSRRLVSKGDMIVAGEAVRRGSLDQAKAGAADFMDALYRQEREKWGHLSDADAIALAIKDARADRIARREAAEKRDAEREQARRTGKRSHDLLADMIRRKGYSLCKKYPSELYSQGRGAVNEFCLQQCSVWHLEAGNTDSIVVVAAVEPAWGNDEWLSDELEARCSLFRLVCFLHEAIVRGVPVRRLQCREEPGRPLVVKTLENGTTEFIALVACGSEHCDIVWEPATRVHPRNNAELTIIRTGNAILNAYPFTDYGVAQERVDAVVRRLVSGGRRRN